jgi:hypothetical protein
VPSLRRRAEGASASERASCRLSLRRTWAGACTERVLDVRACRACRAGRSQRWDSVALCGASSSQRVGAGDGTRRRHGVAQRQILRVWLRATTATVVILSCISHQVTEVSGGGLRESWGVCGCVRCRLVVECRRARGRQRTIVLLRSQRGSAVSGIGSDDAVHSGWIRASRPAPWAAPWHGNSVYGPSVTYDSMVACQVSASARQSF